jgi:hypothetical protein
MAEGTGTQEVQQLDALANPRKCGEAYSRDRLSVMLRSLRRISLRTRNTRALAASGDI